MLPILCLSLLAWSRSVLAQETNWTNVAALCPRKLEDIAVPGALSVYKDVPEDFVSSYQECRSTNQRIISRDWEDQCNPAYERVCSIGYNDTWNWAWNNIHGSTCQVGLYRPSATARLFDQDCCRLAFASMLAARHQPTYRFSINIAEGGFPRTTGISTSDGSAINFQGQQVDSNYPSYILQGYETSLFASFTGDPEPKKTMINLLTLPVKQGCCAIPFLSTILYTRKR